MTILWCSLINNKQDDTVQKVNGSHDGSSDDYFYIRINDDSPQFLLGTCCRLRAMTHMGGSEHLHKFKLFAH